MKLYTFELAPNPRRLQLFLDYKGIELDTTEVSLANNEQFADAYRAINPACTVPALQIAEGQLLSDVIAISYYLEQLYPDKPLFGVKPLQQAQVLGWCHRIYIEGLAAVAEMLRNQGEFFQGRALPGEAPVEQIPALIERGQQRLQVFFNTVDSFLQGKNFLVGDSLTMADIDLLVVCDFSGWVKETIPANCEQLQQWYQRVNKVLALTK